MVYRDCFTGTRLYFDSQDGLAKSERIVRLRLSVFGSESDHRFEDQRSHERGRLGLLAAGAMAATPKEAIVAAAGSGVCTGTSS